MVQCEMSDGKERRSLSTTALVYLKQCEVTSLVAQFCSTWRDKIVISVSLLVHDCKKVKLCIKNADKGRHEYTRQMVIAKNVSGLWSLSAVALILPCPAFFVLFVKGVSLERERDWLHSTGGSHSTLWHCWQKCPTWGKHRAPMWPRHIWLLNFSELMVAHAEVTSGIFKSFRFLGSGSPCKDVRLAPWGHSMTWVLCKMSNNLGWKIKNLFSSKNTSKNT